MNWEQKNGWRDIFNVWKASTASWPLQKWEKIRIINCVIFSMGEKGDGEFGISRTKFSLFGVELKRNKSKKRKKDCPVESCQKICFHEIETERTDVTNLGAEKMSLPNIATFPFKPIVRSH